MATISGDADGPGVYFLFHNERLLYIGRSRCCAVRIASHEANGRYFTRASVMPCSYEDSVWIERALIARFQPPQNKTGRSKPAAPIQLPVAVPEQIIGFELVDPFSLKPNLPIGRPAAAEVAATYGLKASTVETALKKGDLKSFALGGRHWIYGRDLTAWCKRSSAAVS